MFNNYNNNFNNNYGQNQMFGNQMYSNPNTNNVQQTLNELQQLIYSSETNQISSDMIINKIKEMVNRGLLTVVGQGTNRIAVKINGDITPYIDFQGEAIIKVPYAVSKGMDDNSREFLLYAKLVSIAQSGNVYAQEAAYLVDTLPAVSRVKGYPALIAQEQVIAIEKSNYIQTKGTDKEAGECTQLILTRFLDQYSKLLTALNKFCVIADLNPIGAPYQYGFKRNRNGQEVLTILDTGYVIPKFFEYEDLTRRGELPEANYVIVGKDLGVHKQPISNDNGVESYVYFTKNNMVIDSNTLAAAQPILDKRGIYVTNSKNPKEKIIPDITYFMEVYQKYRQRARQSVGGDLFEYFKLITGSRF